MRLATILAVALTWLCMVAPMAATERYKGDAALIAQVASKHGLTRQQTAYVLATAEWETAGTYRPVREAFWLSEAWRKKNLRYWPYYGRGYVQLTWDYNYEKVGKIYGLDLVGHPDMVMEPAIAADILVRGSMEGWFTGRKLTDYINENGTDYVQARRVINGTDKAAKIAVLAAEHEERLCRNSSMLWGWLSC